MKKKDTELSALYRKQKAFRVYDEILSLDEVNSLVQFGPGGKCIIEESWLYQQFVINLKSKESIARMLNNICTGATVARNLKQYGIARSKEQEQQARKQQAAQQAQELQRVYGVTNVSQLNEVKQKKQATCLEHFGLPFSTQSPDVKFKMQATNYLRYGVSNGGASSEAAAKRAATNMERYGASHAVKSAEWWASRKGISVEEWVNRKQIAQEKTQAEHLQKYGSFRHDAPLKLEKERETCMLKYGVPYPCMTSQARQRSSNDSGPNLQFQDLLCAVDLPFEREFVIDKYSYDFKVGNNLIEIDPSATHNSTWGINSSAGKPVDYHQKKSRVAEALGYRCIHVWDWDNPEKIIQTLQITTRLYARQCQVGVVSSAETKIFLNAYHLQGSCKGNLVSIGLFHQGVLVELMTFGRPRYNKKYQWELLRLCTKFGYSVVGGAQKLFKYFLGQFNPISILSYCDRSKFKGDVYNILGFNCIRQGAPSKHWYKDLTKQHFTDNLLRAQGADRLLGTSSGKGTSNSQILLDNNFVEIYDCGQDSWEWLNKKYYDDLQKEFDTLCKDVPIDEAINKILSIHTEVLREDFDQHIKIPA